MQRNASPVVCSAACMHSCLCGALRLQCGTCSVAHVFCNGCTHPACTLVCAAQLAIACTYVMCNAMHVHSDRDSDMRSVESVRSDMCSAACSCWSLTILVVLRPALCGQAPCCAWGHPLPPCCIGRPALCTCGQAQPVVVHPQPPYGWTSSTSGVSRPDY